MRWTDDFATGISSIDDAHRQMLEQIDVMLAASRAGLAAGVQESLASFERHVKEHFGAEERTMHAASFPATATHVAQHTILRAYAKDLRRAVAKYGAEPNVIDVAARLVANALVTHVQLYDRELADFLRRT